VTAVGHPKATQKDEQSTRLRKSHSFVFFTKIGEGKIKDVVKVGEIVRGRLLFSLCRLSAAKQN
jgi:hypothetical protein